MAQAKNRQLSNSVRIIAGDYRSRKLEFPSLDGLRPTADRVRETLFNWLQDSIAGETCLGLFAGSGALGFEALSRNASKVDFIEKDSEAAGAISGNIQRLGTDRGRVHCTDALRWLATDEQAEYGLVFLDPPFTQSLLGEAMRKLEESNVMKDGCLVYIEQQADAEWTNIPANWLELKRKKAGSVRYGLFRAARN